jgi:hypothetical protein
MKKWLLVGVTLVASPFAHAEVPYEVQSHCASDAAEFFKKILPNFSDYESNYSATMNGCFILAKWSDEAGHSASLYDVGRYHLVGDLLMSDKNAKEFWCKFEGANCHSEAEWKTLIKPYLHE